MKSRKTVSRLRPLNGIKILGFIFEIYAEILGLIFRDSLRSLAIFLIN